MNDSHIAIRYTKALLKLSIEKNILQKVYKDIGLVKETYAANDDLREIIESPIIPVSKKKKLFQSIFSKHISKETTGFLRLIIDNKRESYLENIFRDFDDAYKETLNIKSLKLTTATAVNKEVKDTLSGEVRKLLDCEISFEEEINPAIIGGFILRIQDLQYNASVRSQLNHIKQALTII